MAAGVLLRRCVLFVTLCLLRLGDALTFRGSPVRRVVVMLQSMGQKVKKREADEDKVFDDFMCYCKKNTDELEASTGAANERIPQLESGLADLVAEKSQLETDFKKIKQDREAANVAIKEATAMRTNENRAFLKESTDLTSNINALGGAISAMKQADRSGGGAAAFMQSDSMQVIQNLALAGQFDRLKDEERDTMQQFIKQQDGEATTGMDQIVGILSQMLDDMKVDLKQAQRAEANGMTAFQALMGGKQSEVKALTLSLEQKEARYGEIKVHTAEIRYDLDDTKQSLASDEALLSEIQKECAARKAGYAVTKQDLSDESAAIADTIKILSDDDAQNLLSATVPCANDASASSFLQVSMMRMMRRRRRVVRRGVRLLKKIAANHAGVASLSQEAAALVADGTPESFAKLNVLVTGMISILDREQEDDDLKKQMCDGELKRKGTQRGQLKEHVASKISELEESQNEMDSAAKGARVLAQGIVELDAFVAESTSKRKAAHEYFVQVMSQTNQGVEVLEKAKARLECVYKSSASDGGGVVKMISMIQADMKKEVADLKASEEEDQKEYEELMKSSAEKREADSRAITERSESKASHEMKSEILNKKLQGFKNELTLTETVISNLHEQCDWLLEHHEERKKARAVEKEGLQKTVSVLSSADFS